MGYYTRFELKIDTSGLLNDYFFDGNGYKDAKWYSFQDDIKKWAKENPTAEAIISGEGEESGDLWKCYIKNGQTKTVSAVITYPEPDWSE